MSGRLEPPAGRVRHMDMSVPLRSSIALVACSLAVTACSSGEVGVSSGDDSDCTSHYVPVASADTWAGLKEGMLANEDWGRVASLRTQARGEDVDSGLGDEEVVRVMDLLNRKGQRVIQVHVWRTDGGWRAGAWSQCID
jgi:hypothetical protein